MRALDRKLLRDLARNGPQLVAIALVLASGAGLFLAMRSTMRALETARATYYASERFADLFAPLVRAPEHVADDLRDIPGVDRLQTRVVTDVILDVVGMVEAATGRLVSLPDHVAPEVGAIRLRTGRLPERPDEVVAHEAFADAHRLVPGDQVTALIDGKSTPLRIVGTALAPEFTWTAGPGQLLPDDRRFGVLWMGREALAEAFDMDGAFNDVLLQVSRDADLERVTARVDDLLERHGGIGAYPRRDQTSEAFVQNELDQLRTFGTIVPGIALAVAAFLLNIVLGRVVAGQREQIAALKALGYRDREVGLHYAKLVALVCIVGLALGIALAAALGTMLCDLYARFYRFPDLRFSIPHGELGWTFAAVAVAAVAGSAAAIRHTIALPPAEAMRPAAPARYRPTVVERIGLIRLLPPAARIVLRELERRPGRAAMSVLGIALATAMIVISTFAYGSIDHALNVQFGLQQREDVSLSFVEPRSVAATQELLHLPGVLHAEPMRRVPVRLRSGARSDDLAIIGLPRDGRLQNLLDDRLVTLRLPAEGIVLTRKLAETLRVAPGDLLRVELREGERRSAMVPVARIAETFVGLAAWMDLDALARLLRQTPTMNAASLLVDDARLADLHRAVKELPLVAGVAERRRTIESFETLIDENLGVSLTVNLTFALVMAFGVLYNAARITLAERGRDLASLRVLGFRRREVAAILIGELAALTALAIPLGLLLGWLGASAMMTSLDTDQLRLPFVVRPWTYALAVVAIVTAMAVAAQRAWRRLDAIDLVGVLKARD